MAPSQRRSSCLSNLMKKIKANDGTSADSMYTSQVSNSRSQLDSHDVNDLCYASDASESCSSSEIGPPSLHKDTKTLRRTSMSVQQDLFQPYHEPTKDGMQICDDILSRVTGSGYQDFQMSVSYESIEGWTTTTSGSSSKTDQLPPRREGRRRSTIGWKATANKPVILSEHVHQESAEMTRTRSGRIIKPVSRSESMPSFKKRRTMSDVAYRKPRRATTPPVLSDVSRSGPERPQSAMKHKSANRYSQGKDGAIILDTSVESMPQTSPERSPFLTTIPLSTRSSASLRKISIVEEDPDAFSPTQSRSKQRLPLFILRSRASLPRHDFYERHKREEGSPTPETRRLGAI